MTLNSPAMLWWMLAAFPVVALFFFKSTPKVAVVPSIDFWQHMSRMRYAHGFGLRFSRYLTLGVQLLMIAVLSLALAEVSCHRSTGPLIILLDDSATMQSHEASGASHWADALNAIRTLLRDIPTGVPVSVLLAGDPPVQLVRNEVDHRRVITALNAARPRDVNAAVDATMNQVDGMAATDGAERIVLFSDRLSASDVGALGRIELHPIGEILPNASLGALRLSEDQTEILATLTVTGLNVDRINVRFLVEGKAVASKLCAMADGADNVRFVADLEPGQPFELEAVIEDGFSVDNTLFGVWPPNRRLRVRLVSDGSAPLLAALSQSGVDVEQQSVAAWNETGDVDVTVLDNLPRGLVHAAKGRYLIFGGGDPFGQTGLATPQKDLHPELWNFDEGLFKSIDLSKWRIRTSAGMAPSAHLRTLAETRNGTPLVLEHISGAGDVFAPSGFSALYVNAAVADTNLSFRYSFPLFVWNAIDHLVGAPACDMALAHATGENWSTFSRGAEGVSAVGPTGMPCACEVIGGQVRLVQTPHAGIYQIQDGNERFPVAFNWTPKPDGRQSAHKEVVDEPSRSAHALPPAFSWLLAVGVVIAMAELWLFHRGILRLQ